MKLYAIVKRPDVEQLLMCSNRNVWGNYQQRPVGSSAFPSTALLTGAPLLQQQAAVPAVSFSHWPQTNDGCLAQCNLRCHWLTTAVHELVKDYSISNRFTLNMAVWGLLSLIPGIPFSLFHIRKWFPWPSKSLTAPLLPRSHPWESVLPPRWKLYHLQYVNPMAWYIAPEGTNSGMCWLAVALAGWASHPCVGQLRGCFPGPHGTGEKLEQCGGLTCFFHGRYNMTPVVLKIWDNPVQRGHGIFS